MPNWIQSQPGSRPSIIYAGEGLYELKLLKANTKEGTGSNREGHRKYAGGYWVDQ